jgi:hypothetical protein
MSRAAKNVPMCVVNIGYHCDLLMPADKGMKLVTLLQESIFVSRKYESRIGDKFIAGDAPEVQYSSVKADQVVMPSATLTPTRRKGPLLLESD